MNKNKIFVRITNKEIYKEIIEIKQMLNDLSHKSKLAFWIASTALTISLSTIAAIFTLLK